jgi:hypothetical protein
MKWRVRLSLRTLVPVAPPPGYHDAYREEFVRHQWAADHLYSKFRRPGVLGHLIDREQWDCSRLWDTVRRVSNDV